MKRLSAFSLAALMGLAVAAGCSSGGAGKIDPLPAKPQSLAQFVITVPTGSSSTSASTRKPQFEVPNGTQSVTIQLTSVNGTPQSGQTVTVNLSASNTACTSANGKLTCTATVPGLSGADVFTVTSYSQPNGQGTVIAKGNAAVTTASGQTTTVPITLSGTVASIAISFGGIALSGVSGSVPVIVNVKDSTGATIMGTYDKTITLANSDGTGATKLSATTLNDSTVAAAITLSYNGATLAKGAVISATASGVDSSKITNGTFTPNGDYATNNGMTLTYSATASITYGTGAPQQGPAYTFTDTFTTGATFNGQSNLLHMQQVRTGNSTGFLGSSYTDDLYFAFQPIANGIDVNEIGWTSMPPANSKNACTTSTIASSPWLIAVLPFNATNAWDSSGTYVDTYTCTSGYSDVYAFNKDGSYDDRYSDTQNNYSGHSILHSDGTASDTSTDGYGTYTRVMGTPQPAPTGTPGMVIPITETYTPATPAPNATPAPAPTPTYIPDWYPNGGKVPSPLQSNKMVDKGQVMIPAGCNVSASIATTAEQLEETYFDIDPMYGYLDNATNEYYMTPNIGLVCATFHDVIQRFESGVAGSPATYDSLQTLTQIGKTPTLSSARNAQSMTQASAMSWASFQSAISKHMEHHRQMMQQERRAAARARMVKSQLRNHA